MNFRFWGRPRPSPSVEAIAAVQEAVAIRAKQNDQAQQFEHHLESNGFAEMVETIFMLSAKKKQ